MKKVYTLPLFDLGFSTLHCFLYFELVNYVATNNKCIEQHNVSFISINTISHKYFLDDKDDYEVENFESLSALFYFLEKPDPNL